MLEQATRRAVPDEFVESFARGALVTGEFHCSECGYGVTVHSQLPRCPMCGGRAWDEEGWRPFAENERVVNVDADAPLVRDAHKVSAFPRVPLS